MHELFSRVIASTETKHHLSWFYHLALSSVICFGVFTIKITSMHINIILISKRARISKTKFTLNGNDGWYHYEYIFNFSLSLYFLPPRRLNVVQMICIEGGCTHDFCLIQGDIVTKSFPMPGLHSRCNYSRTLS